MWSDSQKPELRCLTCECRRTSHRRAMLNGWWTCVRTYASLFRCTPTTQQGSELPNAIQLPIDQQPMEDSEFWSAKVSWTGLCWRTPIKNCLRRPEKFAKLKVTYVPQMRSVQLRTPLHIGWIDGAFPALGLLTWPLDDTFRIDKCLPIHFIRFWIDVRFW